MARELAQQPFHERLAEKLIEQLKEGTAPWQKPWAEGAMDVLPFNPATGKRYKGVNAVSLLAQEREDNRWMTYKQAVALGGQVRKGEKSTSVVYWKFEEEQTVKGPDGKPLRDSDGEIVKSTVKLERPRAFYASVFNAEQMEGLPPREVAAPRPFSEHARAEAIMTNSGVPITEAAGSRAYYVPATDSIRLPARSQFASEAGFYAIALHELGHATGHPTRLGRDLSGPFGSESYAREELRAEIASLIVGGELGTGHDPGQHTAYVASWIKLLEEQPLEIMRACADAEKIAEHVMQWEHNQSQTLAPVPEMPAIEDELGDVAVASWNNLRDTAARQGLAATITRRAGDADPEGGHPHYVVHYEHEERGAVAVTTSLFHDGRALTFAQGERVPGTSYTSDLESQREALTRAVAIERTVAEERREHVITTEHQRFALAAARCESDGDVGASNGQCHALAEAIADHGFTDKELFGRELGDDARLDSSAAAHAVATVLASKGRERPAPAQADAIGEATPVDAERVYIRAPYADRREVRALGGEWDAARKSWYVPAGIDAEPFAKWRGEAVAESTPRAVTPAHEERTYLAVPYGDREEAKALGARWDKAAKAWYAPAAGASEALTERWGADRAKRQPTIPPREEFKSYLEDLGLKLVGDEPIMDGDRHRVPVEGDKRSERSGFYVGFLDGHPAGFAMNNRTGVGGNWKSSGYSLTDEERAQLRAEAANKLQEREAARVAVHEEVAVQCAEELRALSPVTADTPYIKAKGIGVFPGAFEDAKGNTVVPAYDVEGRHWTNQTIRSDAKLFAKDGRKEGCFHVIGGQEGLRDAPAIVITEGYSTAATLASALGYSTVAAFDAGNLRHVAEALASAHPAKPIVIAGDDDYRLELRAPYVNRGRAAAEEAARAVGGTAIVPVLAQADRERGLSDFNDLDTRAEHTPRDARAQIEPHVRQQLAERAEKRQEGLEHALAIAATREPQRQEREARAVRIRA